MPFDYKSFLAGVQVGRRLKVWDAGREPQPPAPPDAILTEDGIDMNMENGEVVIAES